MSNFIAKGKTVWVPKYKCLGSVVETDHTGNITKVEIDGSIIETANLIVELWDLFSALRKLFLLIFKK